MNGAALASLIAGFGTGYLSGKDRAEDRKRQAALDQITLDRAAREKESWDAQKAQQQQIAQAATPVVAQAGTQVTDAGGNQNFAAQQGDSAWLQQQARMQAELQGADASPDAGAAMARYGVTTAAGKPIITDQATAQATADAANTPDAQLQRVSKVLMGYDPARALQLQQQGVQTKLAQANLDQTQQQEAARKQQAEIVSAYATGGRASIPQIYSRYNNGMTAKVDDQGTNGFTVTTFDKSGKPLGSQFYKNDLEFLGHTVLSAGYDPTKWLGFKQGQASAEQAQANADRAFDAQQKNADRSYNLQASRVAAANASDARTAAAASAKADAAVGYYKETHPDATQAQLAAVRSGVISAATQVDGSAPSQVKLAQAMVSAGLEPNMSSALRRAMQSGDKTDAAIRADLYKAALGNPMTMGDPQAAVDKAMNYLQGSRQQNDGAKQAFVEGKVYQDANGNKARFVGGMWVPVK